MLRGIFLGTLKQPDPSRGTTKMKLKFAFASLLVLSACGTSQEALQALDLMQFRENATVPGFSYSKLSGSGNDVKLEGVSFLSSPFMAAMMGMADEGAEAEDADAESVGPVLTMGSVVLNGLTMKDGKPVVRDFVFNGISPVGDMGGTTVTVGSIGIEGMDETTGAFIAGAFTEAGPGEIPAFEAWKFGKAAISNIAVKGEVESEAGLSSFDVKVGELSVSNLNDTMMGLVRIAGIAGEVNIPTEMVPISAVFDLGKLDIANLNSGLFVKPFMMGMEAAMTGSTEPDFASMYADYTSPLEAGYDRLDWSGLSVDVSGLKLNSSPLSSVLTRNADGVVTATEMPLASLKLTADSSGGMAGAMGLMVLAMAGYPSDSVEIYAGGKATFDPEKDITRYTGYNLGVTDVVDVKMDVGVVGLQAALPALMSAVTSMTSLVGDAAEPELDDEGNPVPGDSDDMSNASTMMAMQMMMAIMPLQLTDLDLSITDESLVKLILNQQAAGAGQSLDDYRADLVAMVQGASVFMSDAGVDPAIANELTAAAAGFLSGPGTLRLQIKPKQPFGVLSAMAAPITKDSLGFSATFTPAAAPEPATN